MEELQRVSGAVDGIIYRNEENSYSIIVIRQGKTEVTAKGIMPALSVGEQVEIQGEWIEDRKYGREFKCKDCRVQQPTTLDGITKYLGSGIITGVGMKMAKQIVAHFGEDTLKVLSENPERLQEIRGIGKKSWKIIADSFRENHFGREASVYLQQYGVTIGLAQKIVKKYGARTVEIIKRNPYQLLQDDIEGVGFVTADKIAAAMGVPQDDENRVQAAVKYILANAASGSGHAYLTENALLSQTAGMLDVDINVCSNALEQLHIMKQVRVRRVDEENRVYLPWMDEAEKEVALRLCELLCAGKIDKGADVASEITEFEKLYSINFSNKQRAAITKAVQEGVLVVTGGPGTGKTTIIKCIIHLLSKEGEVLLCAPTGRAAKRMSEATGFEAKTIHRLLEYSGEDGGFSRNQENPLECSCVIVDEMSMVDLTLMRGLLRAIDPGTRLIVVGDADQLPSVGAGNVLEDVLESGVVPAVRLTDIFRQEECSRIVVNAHRINHGQMPLLNEKGTDFFFERKDSIQDVRQTIVQLVMKRLPKYFGFSEKNAVARAMSEFQVLSPMRKGECGVNSLNPLLQDALNPPLKGKPSLTYGDTTYRLYDKVIQTKNDYEIPWRKMTSSGWEDGKGIFNGDVGFVTNVDEEDGALTVTYDDNREVEYDSGESMENLELAYCLSVHKSQGSEFPVVIIPVVQGPAMLLTRNLLYTALTRAKKMVVLVGREEIIRQMVENDRIVRRNSSLDERLQDAARLIEDEQFCI